MWWSGGGVACACAVACGMLQALWATVRRPGAPARLQHFRPAATTTTTTTTGEVGAAGGGRNSADACELTAG
jgi:hypothetical protein